MQPQFQKYLALYKKLTVPGIGNFTVIDEPPVLQFTDKQWLPPSSHIHFAPVVHPTNNHFYHFLAREWEVEKVIAIRRYKEEVEKMMDDIKQSGLCHMAGMGTLRKTEDGAIAFTPAAPDEPSFFTALPAERVMRKYAQHTVLVGEQEHVKDYIMPDANSEDMLLPDAPAKNRWWLYALMLALIAIVMIVVYYATHGTT